jgi:hypothetical protein
MGQPFRNQEYWGTASGADPIQVWVRLRLRNPVQNRADSVVPYNLLHVQETEFEDRNPCLHPWDSPYNRQRTGLGREEAEDFAVEGSKILEVSLEGPRKVYCKEGRRGSWKGFFVAALFVAAPSTRTEHQE